MHLTIESCMSPKVLRKIMHLLQYEDNVIILTTSEVGELLKFIKLIFYIFEGISDLAIN